MLLGVLLLHPEIAAERLEALAEAHFAGAGVAALAGALAAILAEIAGIGAAELRAGAGGGRPWPRRSPRSWRSSAAPGFGGLAEANAERAAAIWDDAAHLRLRAGALSIERQAAATALGRETSEVHLSRLRDIQEQDQRSLRPDSATRRRRR